ncbi:1,2-phenylacetyl-CoA epoxidase subunit PaaE [Flavobacterium aquatile]|uniref:Phenylacetic acid degradation protein n=1 Tax=Flavobacterium aquatile LMG 4008 = ATCC 11947 TaxID=1453498 RepID=A0A095SY31_9FLAO|nr:1,2-phenylacetyl-CoA epoxidase subunit PaaE [Flavobacterium aquatile]KGD69477.1 phenylacetic acid degradation protein [Flavobacterium aquatile LMG 4008 = ATCC 11947]OXA66233.1 phenylacetic acid degradation protein [Flavobacterium aquatile LMG 4008 = ATCC 11947]GEC77546.1 phenylacetic acid degradation protein [Flavobacterium aquatile]
MSKFHSIKIADIYKETKDCSVLSFEIPQELKQEFQYKQGQHLTLKSIINGQDTRRSYSLCSSPNENIWKIAVKKINGGLFSTFVNDTLKKGDTIEVMAPNGEFNVAINSDKPKNYIVFAAGSGITPILSIIKTHLISEPNSTFKLFYLNRTVKSIIFKEEIEQLKNTYFDRFEIFHFLTKEHRSIELLNGRFTKEKLQILTKNIIDIPSTDECFICGPEQMIFLIRDELVAAGLDKNKIHYELFTSGITEEDKARMAKIVEKKVEGTEVTIIDGGKEFHFVMDDDFDNILDGALAAGADLPFACKGGVCSTCKCKVVSGTVEMKINYALDENEVAKGLVLSCQAVPTSEKVVVDFGV